MVEDDFKNGQGVMIFTESYQALPMSWVYRLT